jgi:hypothetical protein
MRGRSAASLLSEAHPRKVRRGLISSKEPQNKMFNNTSHTSSLFQPSSRTKQANPRKQTARFERDGNGWWANRKFGEDNILGYGGTKEEALADLEHQVAAFLDFLQRTGRKVSERNASSRSIWRA